jgi:lipoprotein NlpI
MRVGRKDAPFFTHEEFFLELIYHISNINWKEANCVYILSVCNHVYPFIQIKLANVNTQLLKRKEATSNTIIRKQM